MQKITCMHFFIVHISYGHFGFVYIRLFSSSYFSEAGATNITKSEIWIHDNDHSLSKEEACIITYQIILKYTHLFTVNILILWTF